MTSLAIAKLACDALLFASLIFLSLRLIRKQPNTGANILKLKELELSLKEVVREADEASQNFNNDLLSRKRDLERVLADSQAIEGRISKSSVETSSAVREAELIKQDLEKTIQISIASLQQHETLIERNTQREAAEQKTRAAFIYPAEENILKAGPAEENQTQRAAAPRSANHGLRVSGGKEIIPPPPSPGFEYDKMLEPPSFSNISEATERRIMAKARQRPTLREQIERTTDRSSEERSSQMLDGLPNHLEEALASVEERTMSIRKEDPRLGVLGATRRSAQVV